MGGGKKYACADFGNCGLGEFVIKSIAIGDADPKIYQH